VRYAILSDIHGNLEALRAVLADAADCADGVLCLGDVVGYGADPAACVEIVGARAETLVAGNHDHALAGLIDTSWFNTYAQAALEWTAARVDDDHRAWLGARPLLAEVGDATLVHASPRNPEDWDYLRTGEDGWEVFESFSTRLCFVGHSHRPAVWSLGSSGPEFDGAATSAALENGRRYIVNVGSVGQPRDHDPRAAYAVWDVDARRVDIRRVEYDIGAVRRKILAAGLPRFLADRLAVGR
jgi:diadenosine tetraphosphatase ApaH/serine/threonine PP2A family protein phosphatase